MTNLREAAQMALDALEYYQSQEDYQPTIAIQAIEALRAALAQPEQAPTNNGRYLTGYKAQPEQEPVAYLYKNIEDYEKHVGFECNDAFIVGWNMARTTERMLSNYFYTAPPQREWKGLTDEEYKAIRYGHDENGEPNVEYELFDEGEYGMEVNIYVDDFYRAIEAKLKEKNNA